MSIEINNPSFPVTKDIETALFLARSPGLAKLHAEGQLIMQQRPDSQKEVMNEWRLNYNLASIQPYEPIEISGNFNNAFSGHIDERASEYRGLVVIDLCEVLRHTGQGMLDLVGAKIEYVKPDRCEYVTAIESGYFDPTISPPIVNAMMAADDKTLLLADYDAADLHVKPNSESTDILNILKDIRDSGILIAVNTSTLPHSQMHTIKYLSEFYPNCFDGIMFPGNHFGYKSTLDKGDTVRLLIERLQKLGASIRQVATVEDGPRHLEAIEQVSNDMNIDYLGLAPAYTWNQQLQSERRTANSLEGFERVHDFFNPQKPKVEVV